MKQILKATKPFWGTHAKVPKPFVIKDFPNGTPQGVRIEQQADQNQAIEQGTADDQSQRHYFVFPPRSRRERICRRRVRIVRRSFSCPAAAAFSALHCAADRSRGAPACRTPPLRG